MRPTLSVLIVAYENRDDLTKTLPALLPELGDDDELIVVENKPGDGSAEVVRELAPRAQIVQPGGNTGFAAGVNAGAEIASGELLVILNPDAAPQPGFGEAIRRPWVQERRWGAWQALVTDGEARCINSAGNPIHFTGIVWAGGHGKALPNPNCINLTTQQIVKLMQFGDWPAAEEVAAASGACLAIPLVRWREVGGFPPEFFLYHEDVDLSVRLRSEGHAIGIEPAAVVAHDYEFGANEQKWFWLERNRLAFLVRTYPGALLALLAPALLATELALLLVSARAGWGREKLRANLAFVRWLPRLLRERRVVQRQRTISAGEFAAMLTPDLDSDLISPLVRTGPVRLALRSYWCLVRGLLSPLRH